MIYSVFSTKHCESAMCFGLEHGSKTQHFVSLFGCAYFSDFAVCTESHLGCGVVPSNTNSLKCYGSDKGCLFDLEADPCEYYDVGDQNQDIRGQLIARLEYVLYFESGHNLSGGHDQK